VEIEQAGLEAIVLGRLDRLGEVVDDDLIETAEAVAEPVLLAQPVGIFRIANTSIG
jgi:hypothetical protein